MLQYSTRNAAISGRRHHTIYTLWKEGRNTLISRKHTWLGKRHSTAKFIRLWEMEGRRAGGGGHYCVYRVGYDISRVSSGSRQMHLPAYFHSPACGSILWKGILPRKRLFTVLINADALTE